jgi:hypothetical protein
MAKEAGLSISFYQFHLKTYQQRMRKLSASRFVDGGVTDIKPRKIINLVGQPA